MGVKKPKRRSPRPFSFSSSTSGCRDCGVTCNAHLQRHRSLQCLAMAGYVAKRLADYSQRSSSLQSTVHALAFGRCGWLHGCSTRRRATRYAVSQFKKATARRSVVVGARDACDWASWVVSWLTPEDMGRAGGGRPRRPSLLNPWYAKARHMYRHLESSRDPLD